MLNWRLEENQYVEERLKEYRKELNGLALMFMSKKQLNKNIAYITEQAKLNYRATKLDDYLDEIIEERKRIDKLVNDLNNKFDNYMSEQRHIISKNIRPFQMEAKPYDGLSEPTLSQLEVVTIHCEPFKLAFIQEKIKD
jgi:hypothetical protein